MTTTYKVLILLLVLVLPEVVRAELLVDFTPKHNSFEIELLLRSSCVFGDADAIKLDSSLSAVGIDKKPIERNIFITVEPLVTTSVVKPGEDAVQVKVLSEKDFGLHGRASFKLPRTANKTELYGIFICIGNAKDAEISCRDKPPVSYSEIFKNHQVQIDRASWTATSGARRSSVKERLYFFRPLLVQSGRVLSLKRSLNRDDYQQLQKMLVGEMPEAVLRKGLQQLKHFGQLGSMPLQQREYGYQLVLPYYNYAKCIDMQ